MSNILILHSSTNGQAIKICQTLVEELQGDEHSLTLQPLIDSNGDFSGYDAVVIGASIYHGKHNPAVFEFIATHKKALEQVPSAFFSVNLVARKPEKNTAETNPYVQQFLTKTEWQPNLCSVFGGKIDYQSYSFFDRNIIRFIMWLTKGPTNADACIEYTDWNSVKRFAQQIAQLN
ncbi:menaquinone-dependent protoporphyrinogen IX dehydrogenase [Paraferrimonas haliotis]|uniref:Protoporphyrinogen IX dehydrogenase [quinone] n=1 Tax=Paraferrimonas haliotis TaxID=2013866 RepID=A0AA37WY76_9GAMM|nr:menaquinone-dependent protoporphyrinogen IX dehydrogenase [Paraferrimonas haliotis]GLS84199.1 oxygen-independent protoporphyrinogen oxidase HemG [Paraferrimonas haliotis]